MGLLDVAPTSTLNPWLPPAPVPEPAPPDGVAAGPAPRATSPTATAQGAAHLHRDMLVDPPAVDRAAMAEIAAEIYDDGEDLVREMRGRSPAEVAAIREEFAARYGMDILEHVAGDANKSWDDDVSPALAQAALSGDAAVLALAELDEIITVDGGAKASGDDDAIVRALEALGPEDRKRFAAMYKARTGRTVQDVFELAMEGKEQERAIALATGDEKTLERIELADERKQAASGLAVTLMADAAPGAVAARLSKAVTADEMVALLRGRSPEEIALISACFPDGMKQGLGKRLELKDVERVNAAMSGDAVSLTLLELERFATTDGDDREERDEEVVVAQLRALKDPAARRRLADAYQIRTGRSFDAFLADSLDGQDLLDAQQLVTEAAFTGDDSAIVASPAARQTLDELERLAGVSARFEATYGLRKEETFEESMVTSLSKIEDPAERRQLAELYEARTGRSFEGFLALNLDGQDLRSARAMLGYGESAPLAEEDATQVAAATAQLQGLRVFGDPAASAAFVTSLGTLSPAARAELVAQAARDGLSVTELLGEKLSGHALERAVALVEGNELALAAMAGFEERKKAVDMDKIKGMATEIFDGIDMGGTDDALILKRLASLRPEEVERLEEEYQRHYGCSLYGHIAGDMEEGTPEYEGAMAALRGDRVTAAYYALEFAADGAGTTVDLIHSVLEGLNRDERRELARLYPHLATDEDRGSMHAMFKDEMDQDGEDYEIADALAEGDLATATAIRIIDADGDVEAVTAELAKCTTAEQRAAVLAAIGEHEKTGSGEAYLAEAVDAGAGQDAVMALADGDKIGARAAMVGYAADGVGTDHDLWAKQFENADADTRAAMIARLDVRFKDDGGYTARAADEMGEDDVEYKRMEMLRKDGKLEDGFAIYYAIEGMGTRDVKPIKDALKDKTPDQIAAIARSYVVHADLEDEIEDIREDHPGEDPYLYLLSRDLIGKGEGDDREEGDLDGADGFEVGQLLKGKARNDRERIERAKEKHAFYSSGIGLGALSDTGEMMDLQLGRIEEMEALLDRVGEDGNLPAAEKARLDEYLRYLDADAQSHDKAKSAVADGVSTGIALTSAIAGSIASFGAASPALVAMAASILGGGASIGAKAAIKGDSYGKEELVTDIALAAVDTLSGGIGASGDMLEFGGDVAKALKTSKLGGGLGKASLGASDEVGEALARGVAGDVLGGGVGAGDEVGEALARGVVDDVVGAGADVGEDVCGGLVRVAGEGASVVPALTQMAGPAGLPQAMVKRGWAATLLEAGGGFGESLFGSLVREGASGAVSGMGSILLSEDLWEGENVGSVLGAGGLKLLSSLLGGTGGALGEAAGKGTVAGVNELLGTAMGKGASGVTVDLLSTVGSTFLPLLADPKVMSGEGLNPMALSGLVTGLIGTAAKQYGQARNTRAGIEQAELKAATDAAYDGDAVVEMVDRVPAAPDDWFDFDAPPAPAPTPAPRAQQGPFEELDLSWPSRDMSEIPRLPAANDTLPAPKAAASDEGPTLAPQTPDPVESVSPYAGMFDEVLDVAFTPHHNSRNDFIPSVLKLDQEVADAMHGSFGADVIETPTKKLYDPYEADLQRTHIAREVMKVNEAMGLPADANIDPRIVERVRRQEEVVAGLNELRSRLTPQQMAVAEAAAELRLRNREEPGSVTTGDMDALRARLEGVGFSQDQLDQLPPELRLLAHGFSPEEITRHYTPRDMDADVASPTRSEEDTRRLRPDDPWAELGGRDALKGAETGDGNSDGTIRRPITEAEMQLAVEINGVLDQSFRAGNHVAKVVPESAVGDLQTGKVMCRDGVVRSSLAFGGDVGELLNSNLSPERLGSVTPEKVAQILGLDYPGAEANGYIVRREDGTLTWGPAMAKLHRLEATITPEIEAKAKVPVGAAVMEHAQGVATKLAEAQRLAVDQDAGDVHIPKMLETGEDGRLTGMMSRIRNAITDTKTGLGYSATELMNLLVAPNQERTIDFRTPAALPADARVTRFDLQGQTMLTRNASTGLLEANPELSAEELAYYETIREQSQARAQP